MLKRLVLSSAIAISSALLIEQAAAGPLTVYCPMSDDDCGSVLKAFQKDTGVASRFVRIGAGEILARIRAEKANPQAGLWLAGAADNFIQGAMEGLLAPHKPKGIEAVDAKYVDPKHAWTPISISPIVFAYSQDYLKTLKAAPPKSWKDFADPVFAKAVALAHPAASGTAYVSLATLVQLMGEDSAFDLMKKIDKNVVQYTRSGTAPSRMAATGEVALATAFSQDVEAAIHQGYPLSFSFPEEGTGFEVNAAAVVANAPEDQRKDAAAFLDWILTENGQKAMGLTFRGPIVPGFKNPNAKIDIKNVKLINYDPNWAGQNRARLLDRYENDVRRKSDAK